MAKEHEQYGIQSLRSFVGKGVEGMSLNAQYVQSRWQLWLYDQKIKAILWKKRPDLRSALWEYPYRDPLPPVYQQLYKKTVQDMRRALGPWHNRWIMVPSCSFGSEMDGTAAYSTYRHDIKVALVFKYWHRQIHYFLPLLQKAMKMVELGQHQKVPWVHMGEGMMQRAKQSQELFRGLESEEYFPHLGETWACFLQELPPLLEECERSDAPPEALLSWCESLIEFDQELRQCLRSTFLHELTHAWTRWIACRNGKLTYRVVGLEDRRWDRTEATPSLTSSTVHTGLNEALTEWIAERLDFQLYRTTQPFHWKGLSYSTMYPAWIIGFVVQALDYHWARLEEALPSLVERKIANATDFLYALYFTDAGLVACFKAALSVLSGDSNAFEKLSSTCDHFYQGHSFDQEEASKSFGDLRRLLAPILDGVVLRSEPLPQELNGDI